MEESQQNNSEPKTSSNDGQPVEIFLENETSGLVNHKPSFVPRSTEDTEEIVIDDSDDSKSPQHEPKSNDAVNSEDSSQSVQQSFGPNRFHQQQNKSLNNKKVCFKDLESSS